MGPYFHLIKTIKLCLRQMEGTNNYNWFCSFSFLKENSQLTIKDCPFFFFKKLSDNGKKTHYNWVTWYGIMTVIHLHWATGTIPACSTAVLYLNDSFFLIMLNCRPSLVCRKAARWYCCPRNPGRVGICLSFPLCKMGNSNSCLSEWMWESDDGN